MGDLCCFLPGISGPGSVGRQLLKELLEAFKVRAQWTFWSELPKRVVAGTTYAEIGGWLFTRHAIERMVPRGLGGRGIPPDVIFDTIRHGRIIESRVVDGVIRDVIRLQNVSVVIELATKTVVTVITYGP